VTVQTCKANALLFFSDEQYLGELDNHNHTRGRIESFVTLDLSHFKTNQQYLFEIPSMSLGLDSTGGGGFETHTHFLEHQKGLIGKYLQIYTEEGSSKVSWDTIWTKSINKPITWFQA
jgi:hypothetical protein